MMTIDETLSGAGSPFLGQDDGGQRAAAPEDSPAGKGLGAHSLMAQKKEGLASHIQGDQQAAPRKTSAFRQWRNLPGEIRSLSVEAARKAIRVQNALYDYRLVIIGLSYKSEQVDDEIWEHYLQLIDALPKTRGETFRFPLPLRRLSRLQAFYQAWQEIIAGQDQLLDLAARAPQALEFYNMMQLLKQREDEERVRQAENETKIAAALQSLEKSLDEVQQRYIQSEPIVVGSEILRFEDAQRSWEQKLNEIQERKVAKAASTDEILGQISKLEEVVREAPASAQWIRILETKLSQLISSHEVLVSLGRSAIPQEELARITVMMHEQVPQIWNSGNLEELGRILQGVEKFISYYDNTVKAELEMAERRRPGITRSLTSTIEMGKNGLSSLTILARSLINAIDSRDPYMRGHSEEVTQVSLRVGRKLNMGTAELERLELAALLHDVGKLSIPETILSKVTPLTVEERMLIEKHPLYGANIVKEVPLLQGLAPWIYHHQERWDGKGYPDHISKKDIPLASSIISLAEAYTVMTKDLPYRKAVPEVEVISLIEEQSERQFSPQVVEAFVDTHRVAS